VPETWAWEAPVPGEATQAYRQVGTGVAAGIDQDRIADVTFFELELDRIRPDPVALGKHVIQHPRVALGKKPGFEPRLPEPIFEPEVVVTVFT
jgi:hypothetical protein